jgi:hypothetical protein
MLILKYRKIFRAEQLIQVIAIKNNMSNLVVSHPVAFLPVEQVL